MPKDRTAAGFVLACEIKGQRLYLLLKNARHGAWGFPKGHSEDDETPMQTALRETREETGITDLQVIPGFEVSDTYQVHTPKRGEYRKTVTYFLARTPKAAHVQSHEHAASGWFDYTEAREKLAFPALQETLKKAEAALKGEKG
jgi:bis(5'-nucleosidyl)-tetraphosphatase